VERGEVVKHSQDDCARLERLLARMDDAVLARFVERMEGARLVLEQDG